MGTRRAWTVPIISACRCLTGTRRDAEVAVPELTLDDDQWYALAGHFDRVGVTELVRREASPHAGSGGRSPQLGASRRW
jgi:hypothetical protein